MQAGFFLLLAHAAMKGLAFLCKGVCHFYCDTTTDRRAARHLAAAAAGRGAPLRVALAGWPACRRWRVCRQVVHPGRSRCGRTTGLAYVGVAVFLVNTLLSLGYYLPLIATLFTPPDAGSGYDRPRVSGWMAVPLVVLGW